MRRAAADAAAARGDELQAVVAAQEEELREPSPSPYPYPNPNPDPNPDQEEELRELRAARGAAALRHAVEGSRVHSRTHSPARPAAPARAAASSAGYHPALAADVPHGSAPPPAAPLSWEGLGSALSAQGGGCAGGYAGGCAGGCAGGAYGDDGGGWAGGGGEGGADAAGGG